MRLVLSHMEKSVLDQCIGQTVSTREDSQLLTNCLPSKLSSSLSLSVNISCVCTLNMVLTLSPTQTTAVTASTPQGLVYHQQTVRKKCSHRRLSKELNTYKCRNHSKVRTSYAPCSPPSFSSYTVDIAKIKLDTCLDICLDTPAMGAELSLGVEVTPGAVEHSIHVQGCQKCIVRG